MRLTQLVIHLDLSDERGFADFERALAALRDAGVSIGENVPMHIEGTLNKPLKEHGAAVLSHSVHALAVKPRVANALFNAGFHTIGQILPLTPNQIREVPDIGRAGAMSINTALMALGLR